MSASTGAPVEGAAVALEAGGEAVYGSVTDRNGFYQIGGLAPGEYTLRAIRGSSAFGSRLRHVQHDAHSTHMFGRVPMYAGYHISADLTDVDLTELFGIGRNDGRGFDLPLGRLEIQAGAINAYDRPNMFYYDLFTARRVDQLPLAPYASLTLRSR